MFIEIIYSIILNMSVLLLFAQLITRIYPVKRIIINQEQSIRYQIVLMIFFGLLGIFATISGVTINNAIVNVRTITIVSGGILFGPVVGIGSGIIAAFHRLFFTGYDFTSLACGISTLFGSIVGSLFYKKFKNDKPYFRIILIVALIESTQMLLIVLLAKPYSQAIELVNVIAIPMVALNSLGVALFISVFESIFISTEAYSAKKVGLVLDIAQKCLPFLRKGINDIQSLEQAANIILNLSSANMVTIADTKKILVTTKSDQLTKEETLTKILKDAKLVNLEQPLIIDKDKCYYICTQLCENNDVIGYLIISMPVNNLLLQSKVEFVDGLGKIMSTQLELAQIENFNAKIKKAEFDTLQSQINPHFLFNVLNTIISISRYDSEKSRQVLVDLSIYFRSVLKKDNQLITIDEEINNIKTYINLEKVRFEDRIDINIDYNYQKKYIVPRFIIQPLVENAIKHGLKNKEKGLINVSITEHENYLRILVHDNGVGIDTSIIKQLLNNNVEKNKIGLSNVHHRLINFYGSEYGLEIKNNFGTTITMKIPYKENTYEHSNSG